MASDDDIHVWVRRQWNDRDIGRVRFADLSGFHWSQYGSGHKYRFGGIAPQPFLHAYMLCTDLVEGEIGDTVSSRAAAAPDQGLHDQEGQPPRIRLA